MLELTILSPHQDDAAFSLGLSLLRWSSLPVITRVVNVFTVSNYAPNAGSDDRSTITSLRRREDRRALRLVHGGIKIESLNLLDAPIRLGINADSVCLMEARPTEVESLAIRIRKYFRKGLVLAPLGLGNHVDHLTLRAAAITNSPGDALAFYEDLPYAKWAPAMAIDQRVSDSQHQTGVPLKPAIIRTGDSIARKRRVISNYHSQVSWHMASMIARFAIQYRGAERIWIPKHGSRWKPLTA